MTAVEDLLVVARAYGEAVGLAPATVSARFLGRGGRIASLEAGGDMGTRTIAAALERFSRAWPENAAWPEGVARPEPRAAAE